MQIEKERTGRSRRGKQRAAAGRTVDYHNLNNPFTPQTVFSADEVEALHQNALRVLQELGMKVLLPEARERFKRAGALVDEDSFMVRIGSDIVEAAIASAPKSIQMRAGSREKDLTFELGKLVFLSGGGCPHATDLERGRRPGSRADFEELVKLMQGFDALQMMQAVVEPQDIPVHERHYKTMRIQLTNSDKAPFVYSRGTGQVEDGFEMLRLFRGLSEDEFTSACHTKTVINTNSPRQLDIPMAQGIIDFARYKQLLLITPFCLLGAMAPVSIAGALSLQHAEALAGITLSQIVQPGAPVMYGSFASNVDMKSGAPAFGTPEHVKATFGSGQLARRLGLPWRSSTGCGANTDDAQAAHETEMSTWAAVLAGATIIVHSAGWLEGGLTISYEKLITDLEMVQSFAELCVPTVANDAEMAFEAIKDVQPGGHFFETQHTMDRYRTAFYEPLVADWSNIGQWTEAGALTADQRATAIWQQRLEAFTPPAVDGARLEALDQFIEKRMAEGGAPPVS